MDDQIIFERITQNDAEALAIAMRRYGAALYSFAFRIVGESHAAEDIVQEVFVNLWEKRHRLDAGPSLRNFLYLSARNLALKHIRKIKTHLAHADRYRFEQTLGLYVVEEERYRLLLEAIDRLPPRTAEIIRYSRDGVPQDEIAQRMGITVATVKLLKSRGIQKLRELLGPLSYLLFFLNH